MVKTPADKWAAKIARYRQTSQNIMRLSQNIRYVGVLNEYGRTLTGVIRPNIKPMLDSKQIRDELYVMASLLSLRNESITGAVGRLNHITIDHQKVSIIVLQKKHDIIYYVTISKKEKGVEKIISEIKRII